MNPTQTKEAIAELRREEERCLDVIYSIRRKLQAGSDAVTPELLQQWEQRLNETHALLIDAGELPSHSEDLSPSRTIH